MNKCKICNKNTLNKKFCSRKCAAIDRGKHSHLLAQEQNSKRCSQIFEMAKQGLTLKEIGLKFNLTRQRIRQLLLKINIDPRELKKNRKYAFFCYECLNCHKKLFKRGKNKKLYFCSRRCSGDYIFKSKLKRDINSERDIKSGNKKYKYITLRLDNGKTYVRTEHRLIMEKHLGRKLKTDEHIHHIDGNGLNNNLSNLRLMKAGDHARLTSLGVFKNIKSIYLGKFMISRIDPIAIEYKLFDKSGFDK